MKEIWKPVKSYKGRYMVSDLGRVKSLPRVNKGRYGKNLTKEIILKPYISGNKRYLVVDLRKDGSRRTTLIHRMVLSSFTSKSLFTKIKMIGI